MDTDHVLRMFSESKSRARKRHDAFMRETEALKKGDVYATIDPQTAKLYGYQGKELAAYLRKDPASVTGYLREEDRGKDVVSVAKRLDKVGMNVNTEV